MFKFSEFRDGSYLRLIVSYEEKQLRRSVQHLGKKVFFSIFINY